MRVGHPSRMSRLIASTNRCVMGTISAADGRERGGPLVGANRSTSARPWTPGCPVVPACAAESGPASRDRRVPPSGGYLGVVLVSRPLPGQAKRFLLFLGRDTGEDEVLACAGLVDGDDDPVAGAGKPAGARDHLDEHGVEVERRADAQDGRSQRGDTLAQCLVLPRRASGIRQRLLPSPIGTNQGAPRRRKRDVSRRFGHRINIIEIPMIYDSDM